MTEKDLSKKGDADATLGSQIYAQLARQIIAGELMPGHRLDEQKIALQFGVSRTPVREALRELGARNLVELIPRRGGVVAKIGTDRLIDMLEAECEIEGLCARLSSHRMSTLEKGHLRDVHERAIAVSTGGTLTAYFEINKEFHDLICAGAHNATLESAARDLRFRLSPFRRPDSSSDPVDVMARSSTEHCAIVDAILSGQAEAAYEAMRTHDARVNLGAMKLLQMQDASRPMPTRAQSRNRMYSLHSSVV